MLCLKFCPMQLMRQEKGNGSKINFIRHSDNSIDSRRFLGGAPLDYNEAVAQIQL